MTITITITRKQAESVLAAVCTQFKTYLEPIVFPAHRADKFGPAEPETTMGPVCDPPTLVEAWDGEHWAVCWEDGPSEWADRVTFGGNSEEERCLVHDAAEESGVAYVQPKGVEPAVIPAGLYVEPYDACTLMVYPA